MHIDVVMWNNIIQEMHKRSESSVDQKIVQLNSENLMLKAQLETSKFEQLSSIHNKCRNQKEKISAGIKVTLTCNVATYIHNCKYKCMYVTKQVASLLAS